jgi:hypothetical protein
MKAIKPLMLSLSVIALACGSAYANDAKNKSDAQAKPSMSQSGSASTGSSATGSKSSGASGSASTGSTAAKDKSPSASAGASGAGSTSARYDFDKADKNKDGQLSRTEFNDMMKTGASAGASTSGSTSRSTAGASGSSAAKTQTPSSGKMDDKPKTSK